MLRIISLVCKFVRNTIAMKVVLAPDSFKGSLTSSQVADAMAEGVKRAVPDAEVVKLPLADGGEGTSYVLCDALCGQMVSCVAQNPMNEPIVAEYCVANERAIIETAVASGLTLVAEHDRNAVKASSIGTGQLILDALNRGCVDFTICLGGSATTDAGMGILEALGAKFYDSQSRELSACGENLVKIESIDVSGLDNRLKTCRFVAVCDVDNELFGTNGAAYVFSPQKGASEAEVKLLDEGLRNFAEQVKNSVGVDVSELKGGGAAGGIGAALVAFVGAELRRGVDVVLDAVRFDEIVADVDVVITGEGKADQQTLMGKLPSGVLDRSHRKGVSVALVAGKVVDGEMLREAGFAEVVCVTPLSMPLEEAMRSEIAKNNVVAAVANLMSK